MPPPSKPRVLVVDDEPSNRSIVQRVLSGAGYDVTAAGNATDAVSALEASGPFALYVLDVLMPGVRGTELAARIRQLQPDARILYFTAYSQALFTNPERLLPGLEAVLQKPVSNRDLLEAASQMLFGHKRGIEG